MTRTIYVTGSGSSGTHVVSRFLSRVLPEAYEFAAEYKDWEDNPPDPGRHAQYHYIIFHRPRPNLSTFYELFPTKGLSILMIRNPIQFWSRRAPKVIKPAFHNLSPNREDKGNVLEYNFILLMDTFNQVDAASAVWRLEDFSRDWSTRRSLVADALGPIADTEDPKDISVKKTRAGLKDGIQPVTESEYPNILSPFEHEAFSYAYERIPGLSKFYPRAMDNCEVVDPSDPYFFEQRYAAPLRRHRSKRLNRCLSGSVLKMPHSVLSYFKKELAVRKLLYRSDGMTFDYRKALDVALSG